MPLPIRRDDADALLARWRALLATGIEPTLRAPVVEASATYFPEPWKGSTRDARIRVWRLARLAHLAAEPSVSAFRPDPATGIEPDGKPDSARRQRLLAWLDATTSPPTVCVESPESQDPAALTAHLARAVAEAWCHEHGVATTGSDAINVEVAMFHLGFGLMWTQATLRQTGRSPTRAGLLGHDPAATLLGALHRLRDYGPVEQRFLARRLPANQAASFKAAVQGLDADEVRDALALPGKDAWPPATPTELAPALPPELAAEDAEEIGEAPPADPVRDMNRDKPVFRVERTMAVSLARNLGFGAMMLSGLVARSMPDGPDMSSIGIWALGLAAAGGAVGRLIPDRRCSEPKCQARVKPDTQECPRCGGTVVGVIGHAKQRLEAEERYLDEHGPQPPAGPQ